MLTARRLAAGTALCAGLLALTAAPAWAASPYVQVTPSTVEAGRLVGIKAGCTDPVPTATVESDAFGSVTVHQQNGGLTAVVTVPPGKDDREYRVRLTCPDGKQATTTLIVIAE